MVMNNKGKHARMLHACVPDVYMQKWWVRCVRVGCLSLHCTVPALQIRHVKKEEIRECQGSPSTRVPSLFVNRALEGFLA